MRKYLVAVSLLALAACSGGGPQTVSALPVTGSSAPVVAGPGGGIGFTNDTASGNGSTTVGTADTFLKVSSATTFNAIGGLQSLAIETASGAQLYQGDASTVRAASGTIAYDPRDGIFTLTLADTKAGVNTTYRYQDPAHRTDFTQSGVPNLSSFNYLEGIGGGNGDTTTTDRTTFFYQRPGESTTYVSLAGYVRNSVPAGGGTNVFERGAFVFGTPTTLPQVPTTGTGTYSGGLLATMINDSNYAQWIAGNSNVTVDFGKSTVALAFDGVVGQATFNGAVVPDSVLTIPTGATFAATGSATIDMVKTGGFTGQFANASFSYNGTKTAVDFAAPSTASSTAGASSIDGAFYGPNAANLGGGFRIVGGVPDHRVDILGAFTGARK